MKLGGVILIAWALVPLTHAQAPNLAGSAWEQLLEAYVDEEGLVDYASLAANDASVEECVREAASLGREEFERLGRDEQLAFLINAYNIFTIELVVRHWPVESIRDVPGDPWKDHTFPLFDGVTLDALEHQLIRPVYDEPRIHFALVCAAVSCPKLIRRPYRGEDLDAVLEGNTRAFLSDSERNDFSDPTGPRVSRIFDWYASDFEAASGSVEEFLKQHGANVAEGAEIEFLEYDWGLNSQN